MKTPVPIPQKYVGYCDILGFSAAVLSDFDGTVSLYRQLREHLRTWPFPVDAKVSLYSDSILVVSESLPSVLDAIVSLNWAALQQGWLIRGGVAYGRYLEEKEDGNLFVVSDALVHAVAIEKSAKVPAVIVSEDIALGIEAWVPRFKHNIFRAPLLYFEDRRIVNPFNKYWFKSSVVQVQQMLEQHPQHHEKYNWFLSLAQSVAQDDLLIPESALKEMLALGILQKREGNNSQEA
jgi:hypothetical protein